MVVTPPFEGGYVGSTPTPADINRYPTLYAKNRE